MPTATRPKPKPRSDLKAELVRRGITVNELARRLNKTRQYVSRLLNGRRPIPHDVAEFIAFKTGIPLRLILPEDNGAEAPA